MAGGKILVTETPEGFRQSTNEYARAYLETLSEPPAVAGG
jgi:hypothetical protein